MMMTCPFIKVDNGPLELSVSTGVFGAPQKRLVVFGWDFSPKEFHTEKKDRAEKVFGRTVDASPTNGSAVGFLGCNDCFYFPAGILNGTKYLQLICLSCGFFERQNSMDMFMLKKRVKISN